MLLSWIKQCRDDVERFQDELSQDLLANALFHGDDIIRIQWQLDLDVIVVLLHYCFPNWLAMTEQLLAPKCHQVQRRLLERLECQCPLLEDVKEAHQLGVQFPIEAREWEVELSAYNKKTTDFATFETYVAKKNEMNVRLASFYQDYTFRRMKMLSFIGRQRTKAKMI